MHESDLRRVFAGEVSGVIGAGAFVAFAGELGDATRASCRRGGSAADRYDLDETETAIVGRRSRREIRLGDPVEVRVDGVEAPEEEWT